MDLVKSQPAVRHTLPSSKNVSVIIYTSGTTGKPKGVVLTHENIVSNLKGLKAIWKDELTNHRSLAFLPWAHVYGQTAELHSLIAAGSAMGIVNNRDLILEALDMIKPTIIMSVPALFNRLETDESILYVNLTVYSNSNFNRYQGVRRC